MKRYSLNLSVGLMSLMAVSAACGGSAVAETVRLPAADHGDHTRMQLSFTLAMADAKASPATPPIVADAPSVAASPPSSPAQPGPDGLVPGGAYIEADQVESLDKNQIVANGSVEMRYKDRTIHADQVQYNSDTGITVATGHTKTINDDGTVQFADSITYDDNMKSGVSYNFAATSRDNAKVFARRVEQIDPNTNELTNVIYTPCDLCVAHGHTQEPSWSIQASRITQRKDKKMVFYQNAIIRLKGVPILYMPYLWTPDPELDRASGFLSPKIGFSKKRGFSYEQPYLWSISPYQQLIISPQLNTAVAPLLNLDYERHFYSGLLHIRGGVTNESFFDNHGNKFGPAEIRDYVLADGAFKINDLWRWNFTAQHVKDDFPAGNYWSNANSGQQTSYPSGGTYANFFERYNIDDAFDKVGDFSVDDRQLISQLNLIRQAPNAYFAVTMASFQSLQIAGYLDAYTAPNTASLNSVQPYTTSSDYYPVIAPMIEAYWSPRARILGGQLTFSLNALGLQHKLFPLVTPSDIFPNADTSNSNPGAINSNNGFDSDRASLGVSYEGGMTTRGGLRWGPVLDLRHDEYHLSNLLYAATPGDPDTSVSFSRNLATTGFKVSYPLLRKFSGATVVIEPIAQLLVSPDTQQSPYQPTEDSQSVEFDETTLFSFDKSPGFDIYEGGARANLGLHTSVTFKSGRSFDLLVGRTLRDKPEEQFLKTFTVTATGSNTHLTTSKSYTYDPSGLGSQNSDWIVDSSFVLTKGLNGYERLRLNSDTLRAVQGEFGMSAFTSKTQATLRYIFNDVLTEAQIQTLYQYSDQLPAQSDLNTFGNNYRDLQLYAEHFFTKNWGVSARLDRDLVANTWRRSTVSVIYKNDCIWYELIYQKNDTLLTNQNHKPQSSIFFRLNFATLGTSGQKFKDVR
ncbi:LPS assembly protein LptD [Asticcacaulis sp. EMRT-3]|uniref:LPS-assembly protein LptD n=1 Tax=Asticcacaulis sp. EMRT-3 TaxID=3040349 RepID=UPI0024AEAF00|nr:LPS assembly protein LptD [Asticcacaulis sp. EMRT-3]MDI7774575.1 LPS assembly protein LptD [Asticcacaulis sp. EMRT-3]